MSTNEKGNGVFIRLEFNKADLSLAVDVAEVRHFVHVNPES
jgi:hypothetical protein